MSENRHLSSQTHNNNNSTSLNKGNHHDHARGGEGRGVLPYLGYIAMCGPRGYGLSAMLVINWVSLSPYPTFLFYLNFLLLLYQFICKKMF